MTKEEYEELLLTPAIPPTLPPEVTQFDCVDYGGYCPRGYNPNHVAGRIRNIPIRYLTEGEWMYNKNTGSSGSVFIFRDATGRELGRACKPSLTVVANFIWDGVWPQKLVLHPTKDK